MKKDSVVYLNTRRKSDFEEQKEAIENFCKYKFSIDQIFHDYRTSSKPPEKREAYQEMLAHCKENGITNIIFHNFLEFSKNMDHGLREFRRLSDEGLCPYCAECDFIGFHDDPAQRTQAIQNFIAYMELYKSSMKKSQTAKTDSHTSNDTRIGRPRALDDGQKEALITVRKSGKSISQICRMFNISRSTVSKILADYPELKGEWKGNKEKQV
ncbi:MAG TPA: resolvase [Methanoculleus sp.]|nr:resolvase [Methanoculleus sp.]